MGRGGLGPVREALGGLGDGHSTWDQVCVMCAETLSVSGAGIVLVAGDQALVSLGVSDGVEGVIEEAQFTLGEGPCVDALRGVAVHEPDLDVPDQTRWPLFTTRAVDAGVAAIFAFPLQAGTTPLGAMNLYRVRPGRLSPFFPSPGLPSHGLRSSIR
ncbi:MAG: hypothetical protein ACRDZ3_06930 [Acidimicrobiia bacterium]